MKIIYNGTFFIYCAWNCWDKELGAPWFKKLRFVKKVILFFKNNTLKKNGICLINRINKFCTLYMIAHFYRLHIWLKREKDILPLFLKSWLQKKKKFKKIKKKLNYFLKNITFWTTHLFINLDQQSMKILHDCTFLYIVLIIGVSNILVPLFF